MKKIYLLGTSLLTVGYLNVEARGLVGLKVSPACELVQAYRVQDGDLGSNHFQLLEDLKIDVQKEKITVSASQKLSHLPHVLWGMALISENVDQLPRKPIDMPSIEGFLLLAKKEYERGELSWTKWRYLQSMNLIRSGAALRSAREGAVISKIERSFPGVVSAELGDFQTARVFSDFLLASGLQLPQLKKDDWLAFADWKNTYPLFESEGTYRAQNLARSLNAIAAVAAGNLPLKELSCAWLVRERTLAQFITLMGTRGAPRLSTEGRLDKALWVNDTPRGEALYPVEDRPNLYAQFWDEDWVSERLAGRVDLSVEFPATSDLLDLLELSGAWILNRSEDLWDLSEAGKPSFKLNLDLLRLGFGVLGVSLKNFSDNHLTTLPGGRIQLKHNSDANLVRVGWVSLALARNLESLTVPNRVERMALNASEMQEYLTVKTKMHQLFTGTVIEAMARRRASRYEVEVLYQFLRQAGDVLDNDYLRNLPRKPSP